jgi:hypothetical protein
MKYKYKLTVTLLWTCAILTTLWITRNIDFFSYLGPLFFICMSGSIFIVRQARNLSHKSKDGTGE